MVKDQNHGFRWWWVRRASYVDEDGNFVGGPSPLTHSSIVDHFPFYVELPQDVRDAGFQAYLSVVDGANLVVHRMPDGAEDMRAFLSDLDVADQQLGMAPVGPIGAGRTLLALPEDERVNFIARAIGNETQTATFFLWVKSPDTDFIPVDSWRLTLQDIDQFWAYYSLRNQADPIVYPVEDGRKITMPSYGPAEQIGGFRDPEKKHYLVMTHGYNNSVNHARRRYDEISKRLFWIGFRGQFVGITWRGNVGVPPFQFIFYDSSTRNAFQTAPGFRDFLSGEVKSWAGGDEQKIDVLAHSMGNLVVWEALRYNQAKEGGAAPALFRNMINVQSAMWPETFHPATDWVYNNEPNPANNITYTVEEQKQHSWRFWFNQPEHPAASSLAGKVVNSHFEFDRALRRYKRMNSRNQRRPSHYHRFEPNNWNSNRDWPGPVENEWRAPLGVKDDGWDTAGPVVNQLHNRVPTFLRHGRRRRNYNRRALHFPVGLYAHPLTDPDDEKVLNVKVREGSRLVNREKD